MQHLAGLPARLPTLRHKPTPPHPGAAGFTSEQRELLNPLLKRLSTQLQVWWVRAWGGGGGFKAWGLTRACLPGAEGGAL